MIGKLISLGRFHLDCLLAYFKPGSSPWSLGKVFRFLTQAFYYFCNGSYNLFIQSAEYLAYASEPELLRIDRALYKHYRYPNQFWLALTEGLKHERPETLYRLTYGETTWFGISRALKYVQATADDVFYDLGCGTGRNVFFAHQQYGMKAVGIDLLSSFVEYGQKVADSQDLSNVEFRQQNIFETSLREATIVYVTANCFDGETMPLLVKRFEELPVGARVISSHRSIPSPRLEVLGQQRVPYSWGVDWMYWHQVKSDARGETQEAPAKMET